MFKKISKNLLTCFMITVVFSVFVNVVSAGDIKYSGMSSEREIEIERELAIEKFNDNPYEWQDPEVQKKLAEKFKNQTEKYINQAGTLDPFIYVEKEEFNIMSTKNSDHLSYQFHFPFQTRAELLTTSVAWQRIGESSSGGIRLAPITQIKEQKSFEEIKEEVFRLYIVDADEIDAPLELHYVNGYHAVPGLHNVAVWEIAPWSTSGHLYSDRIILDKSLIQSWQNYRASAGPTIINYSNSTRSRGFRTPKMQNDVASWGYTMSSHMAGVGLDLTSPYITTSQMTSLTNQFFNYAYNFVPGTFHVNNNPYNINYAMY